MTRRIVAAVLAVAFAVLVAPGFASAESKPQPAGRVNINTASVAQLEALPGVGAQLAARIVEHRQKAGSFRSTQELLSVRGIGEKNLAKLEPFLTVGEAPKPAAK
ncbi:MAG TPA: helix-hairpin-helix domain-containing protein [Vicinamibacteria bacterium]|jgi:competence protein ComEA